MNVSTQDKPLRVAQRVGTCTTQYSDPLPSEAAWQEFERLKTFYRDMPHVQIRQLGRAFVAERVQNGGRQYVASVALVDVESDAA